MKEAIKNNPKKTTASVLLVALIANWGTISDELQEYGILPYNPADPDKLEWLSNWEKPESNVPDYVPQKDKTLFGIKADSAK